MYFTVPYSNLESVSNIKAQLVYTNCYTRPPFQLVLFPYDFLLPFLPLFLFLPLWQNACETTFQYLYG